MPRPWILALGLALTCALADVAVHAQDTSAAAKAGRSRSESKRGVKKTTAKRPRAGKRGASKADPPAEASAPAPVAPLKEPDPKLVDGLSARIRQCFREESGRELSEEDGKLLREYQQPLTRELEPGLAKTGCTTTALASEECLHGLAQLPCAELARPIKRNAWDRHLLPKDRRAIAGYSEALAERKAHCRSERGVDSDPVEQELEASRLGVLVGINITAGRCQLDPNAKQACDDKLAKLPCADVESAIIKNRLIHMCPAFLRCKRGPAIE